MRYCFLSFLVVCSLAAIAQKTAPRHLVFEGAGIRGIAYCGALQELEDRNLVAGVESTAGTSAGAIMALSIALGYSSAEIKEIISSTPFRKFNDGHFSIAGGMHRMKRYFGWYRGQRFEKWLADLIIKKTGNADITFAEMHDLGFKDLYVTGTSLTRQRLVIFSRLTYPGMKVRDAVRISMSIPLYFEAVFMDSSGKLYRHPRNPGNYDVMVDGGFTGNLPIRLFDSAGVANAGTLAFRIDNEAQIASDRGDRALAAMPVTSFREYIAAFYNMVMENLNRQTLTPDDWKRTVSISDGGIGPRIRKLGEKNVNRLVENGRLAMKSYLN